MKQLRVVLETLWRLSLWRLWLALKAFAFVLRYGCYPGGSSHVPALQDSGPSSAVVQTPAAGGVRIFEVVLRTHDGSDVVALKGPSGARARTAWEEGKRRPGIVGGRFIDNGQLRDSWGEW